MHKWKSDQLLKQLLLLMLLGGIITIIGNLLNTSWAYWSTYCQFVLMSIVSVIVVARYLQKHVHNQPKRYELLQGFSISVFSLVFMFLLLELVFKLFVARSDHLSFTLASKNWEERCWNPVNSLGYRDEEWRPETLEGRTKIAILGDSFAAGYGVCDIHDRFSNQLGELLGNQYIVMNMAIRGESTPGEFAALQTFPYQPDVVILTYYINDILTAMAKHDVMWPEELENVYEAPAIVHRSYLLNYIYYQIIRLPALDNNAPYYDFILDGYRDPDIWATHAEELLEIEVWSRNRDIPLIVVIFPNLTQPTETAFITQQVEDLYREHNVPVLNLTEDFVDADPRDLIVNSVDAHPNENVHHQVAIKLYDLMAEQSIVN